MEVDILCRLQKACDSFRKSDIEGCQATLRMKLTEREWEITQMLPDCGDMEIAVALHMTEQAVRDCVEDIYRKLDIRRRFQIAEKTQGIHFIEDKNTGSAADRRVLWAKD